MREWGYQPPQRLEDWASIELEADYAFSWYPEGMERFCNLLFVSSYFVDNKIYKFSTGRDFAYRLIRMLSSLYRPIALFRLKHDIDRFLVEYSLYRVVTNLWLRFHERKRRGSPRPRAASARMVATPAVPEPRAYQVESFSR